MNKDFLDENFFDPEETKLTQEQEKEFKIQRMTQLDDMRWVLSNIKGRRVIWRFLALCRVFRESYVPKDANHTAFQEGKRDIGLRLLHEIQSANPKAYSQMEDEKLSEYGKKKNKGDS